MKKVFLFLTVCSLAISLSGCVWAAVAGVGALGGATGAYMVDKDK